MLNGNASSSRVDRWGQSGKYSRGRSHEVGVARSGQAGIPDASQGGWREMAHNYKSSVNQ